MPVRRILRIDDPNDTKILKTRSRAVRLPNPALTALVADMFATMHAAEGVGLAAPQIGLLHRLAVITLPAAFETQPDGTDLVVTPTQHYTLVNPEIVKISPMQETILDGCLSLPGWYGEVARATWVTVDYFNLEGRRQRIRNATDLLAWALQHEIDHLNGILFTEHIRDITTLKFYGRAAAESDEQTTTV